LKAAYKRGGGGLKRRKPATKKKWLKSKDVRFKAFKHSKLVEASIPGTKSKRAAERVELREAEAKK